ncbi:hypothetical protein C8A03DRAFT_37793 [Achaetomium macrosporum]|uniref:GPI inositol-deacylase n=1 Tax=Achaetomium macrosporum TaxID=79813 RepID=A0AAN7C3L2_9PEZI|nr:hypothetical protein C8A03DRAFT_37793 [Achaetomium macrosporum]
MWKRFKTGRSSSSNDRLDQRSPAPPHLEERSTSVPTVPLSDAQRHNSLPHRNLKTATDAPLPSQDSQRASVFSDIHAQLYSPHRQHRSRSQDRRDDPLGLHVLHTPPERTIDIIFIHGLGGTSLRTWCRDRDLGNLWPKMWLPEELPTARVLTFGYNAHFSSRRERISYTIGDFATELLFRMKYGENTTERLGQVPIVVIAHSMGGLVFKKAFVQGHLNDEFRDIISMIRAVLFLATPHRGTDLAPMLNRLLLSLSFVGHSPKEYITQLARRSPTIDELNEAFRHHASKLHIFSFYETLATATGPMSVMVVDKASAVMGYPNETPMPLCADHHNVCKFTSPVDPNYSSVIGALRSVASFILSPSRDTASMQDLQQLVDLLGVTGPPEEDLSSASSMRKEGTCESFLASEEVDSWVHSKSRRVLWAHSQPGGGKSTLCSLVIERLLDAGHHCSYFFFKYGRRDKQSTSNLLRSLAYQIALQLPNFCRALVDLARSGVQLSKADAAKIWRTVFSSNLAGICTDKSLFWVIDGLDEAESSKEVVELVSRVAEFRSDVGILIFSRPLANISQALQVARRKIPVVDMPLPDSQNDIRLAVAEEISYLPSGGDFKAEIVNEIVARSQGNFLWASLVTKNVLMCHREEQVKRILRSIPNGMHEFYDRMTDAIMSLELDEDKALSKLLLTWAMYANTPVTVEELSEVYPTELGSIMDLNHTVSQVCGQFVAVDPQGRVTLAHHSAREYLKTAKGRSFTEAAEHANEEIFGKCIATLCDKGLRRKLQMLKIPRFLLYASTSWALHLERSRPDSDHVLDDLVRFFKGPYPLAWIQYLAMNGHLSELYSASRALTAYVRKHKMADAEKSTIHCRLGDISILDPWAVDLAKLPSRFGRYLSETPTVIYQCVPALSPAASVIHQKFNGDPAATLSVSGLTDEGWNDCLGRVSGGSGRGLLLDVSPLYLAVASDKPTGTVRIWDTNLFEEHKVFSLGDHIWAMTFNTSGSLLACYADRQTFVWKVSDWSLKLSADNPRYEFAIEFKFDGGDALMMVSQGGRVYRLRTRSTTESPFWEQQNLGLLDEPGVSEHAAFGSEPSCVAFNSDCTQLAVSTRWHFSLSIWTLDPLQVIARLRRNSKYSLDNLVAPVVWHPSGTMLIGRMSGRIFKWNIEDETYDELKGEGHGASDGPACSPDGQYFVTWGYKNWIKIYRVSSMSLIYKWSCEGMIDNISRILFSPDSLRIYFLQGSDCNIWEPDCLLRFAGAASEQSSNFERTPGSFWSDTANTLGASTTLPGSENHAERRPAITDIAPAQTSHGLLVAYGIADGSINVYDTVSKRKHQISKLSSWTIRKKLTWSPRHDRLAYSLLNGAVTIMSVTVECIGERVVSTEPVYSESRGFLERGMTLQLLFHSTGSQLLIWGVDKCQILSIPDGAVLAERQLPDADKVMKFQQHPSDTEHLIGFSLRSATILSATVFSWVGLEPKTSVLLDLSNPAPDANDQNITLDTIDALLDSHSTSLLLLRTNAPYNSASRQAPHNFALFPTQYIYHPRTTPVLSNPAASEQLPEAHSEAIRPFHIPPRLTSKIYYAIGILPDNRLVFLDRQLWLQRQRQHRGYREQ